MSDTTAPAVEVEAPRPAFRPTTGLVREYLVATGRRSAQSRAKIGVEDKIAYLADHPDQTRALAVEAGLPIGTRGVIAGSVFQAVAESL